MPDNAFGSISTYNNLNNKLRQNDPIKQSMYDYVSNKSSSSSNGGGANGAVVGAVAGAAAAKKAAEQNKYLYDGNGTNSNKTSGGSGKASGSSGVSSDYLNALYAQRQGMAQNAYDSAMNRLNDAYNNAAENYRNIYNSGVDTLRGSYNNSQNRINDDAKKSLQEAYINKMLSQKNLAQQLAAQGISGGASESAVAGLINNYGNSRNGITRDWNNNLSDLEQTFNTNMNDLYSAYQNQMAALDANKANAMNTLEFNLANMLMDSMPSISEYISAMGNTGGLSDAVKAAAASQGAFTPNATQATNDVNYVNTTQANDMGNNATNWMKWLEDQYRLGRTSNAATLEMASPKNNVSPEDIAYYLSNSSYYR